MPLLKIFKGEIMFINLNPGKTKPDYLEFPCSVCKIYEETEAELDTLTKGLMGNIKNRQHYNRCKYHPILADPENKGKCPFAHLVGKTIITITCDNCGREIEHLKATDTRLPDMISNPYRIDLCQQCQQLKEKNINVDTPSNVIILRGNKQDEKIEK